MLTYSHRGLYFTTEHIQQTRKNRQREPLQSAWALLLEQEPAEALAAVQWDALRWQFNEDMAAGERAQAGLRGLDIHQPGPTPLDTLAALLTLAQTFEMLRDHPAWPAAARADWLAAFAARVADLNRWAGELAFVETLWLGALNTAAGIVLEQDEWLMAGAALYRRTIDEAVRPEGYLPDAVEGSDGGSLRRQLLAVAALVLTAEMAGHVGIELWGYAARGVSVRTACAYLVFYYYYPEKWRWDTLAEDQAAPVFRQHGGFLEMLNRQARPRDLKLLLDDLRPIYDLAGGGLTTLSHGWPAPRGLFG